MNIDLDKVKPTSIAMVILTVFVTVIPGSLFLFLFNRELFMDVDSFKLILLSLAITLPFFVINTLIYLIWEGGLGESNESDGFQIGVLSGSIITVPVVYLPLLWKLFFVLEWKCAVLVMAGLEILLFCFVVFFESSHSKNKAKSIS